MNDVPSTLNSALDLKNNSLQSNGSESEETTQGISKTIRSLERNNLILVMIGALVSVYFKDRTLTLSFLAGGLLTIINFHLLKIIVKNLTSPNPVPKGKLIAQVLLKFVGGLGALSIIMLVFHPNPVAFLIGLSTVVFVIFIEGILGLFRRQ